MTDQEFINVNRGTRGFFVLFTIIFAASVGIESGSLGWFWVALMGMGLVRIAAIAALLDRAEPRKEESGSSQRKAT